MFDGRESSGTECVLCGGCVDICPEGCLELRPTESLDLTRCPTELTDAVWMSATPLPDTTLAGCAVMIKDEARCIRCGLCAQRCPVGCITLESFYEQEERVA